MLEINLDLYCHHFYVIQLQDNENVIHDIYLLCIRIAYEKYISYENILKSFEIRNQYKKWTLLMIELMIEFLN